MRRGVPWQHLFTPSRLCTVTTPFPPFNIPCPRPGCTARVVEVPCAGGPTAVPTRERPPSPLLEERWKRHPTVTPYCRDAARAPRVPITRPRAARPTPTPPRYSQQLSGRASRAAHSRGKGHPGRSPPAPPNAAPASAVDGSCCRVAKRREGR